MRRAAPFTLVALSCLGAATGLLFGAACRKIPRVGPTDRKINVVGSGTVVDGIMNPLSAELMSAAGVTFEAQDHGSGKAFERAVEPGRQPAIPVRSSRARDADLEAANLAGSFRCVVSFVVAYDEVAFWVQADHPLPFIKLETLKQFLFHGSDDAALPTWASVDVPESSPWGQKKIAILMPQGPKKGGEDSGTRREAERLLAGNDVDRFTLDGQFYRKSKDIRFIPSDVENPKSPDIAPMGLASAAFVGNAKLRPLAIYDSEARRNLEFPARPLWAYVLVPRSAPPDSGVLRLIQGLLSEKVQARLLGIHFKPISEALRSQQLKTLSGLSNGQCEGRALNGLTVVDPPERLVTR